MDRDSATLWPDGIIWQLSRLGRVSCGKIPEETGAAPAQRVKRLHLSFFYFSLIRIVGITGIVPIVTVGYGIPAVSRPPRLKFRLPHWAKSEAVTALVAKTIAFHAVLRPKRRAT